MTEAHFVAGDWGTTHLRLFLCGDDGSALEQRAGPGAAGLSGHFPTVFETLVAPWQQRFGELRTVLCGMVGSSIGWIEAPYLRCPTQLDEIAHSCVNRVESQPQRQLDCLCQVYDRKRGAKRSAGSYTALLNISILNA